MLTLFSQVMVNVKFPYVVYRKGAGLQMRYFALFKLFPVSGSDVYSFESRSTAKSVFLRFQYFQLFDWFVCSPTFRIAEVKSRYTWFLATYSVRIFT